jgi:FtsH-binding integral membrane protein
MESKSSSSTSGLGFGGVLFIVFLVLKLTHVIDWSWWWVTAPLWVPACICILIFIGWVIYQIVKAKRSRSRLQQRFDAFNQERQKILDEKKKRGSKE